MPERSNLFSVNGIMKSDSNQISREYKFLCNSMLDA